MSQERSDMSKNNCDDGPKLREENNYKEFYPSLHDTDLLPLVFDNSKNNGFQIDHLNGPTMFDSVEPSIQYKQMMFNGKVTTQPLVIESNPADFHRCKIDLTDLGRVSDNTLRPKRERKNKIGIIKEKSDDERQYYITKIRQNKSNSEVIDLEKVIGDSGNIKDFTIQYDMDEQDFLYLKHLNTIYPTIILTEFQFEGLITLLEYQWSTLQRHLPIPSPPQASSDQLCSICNSEETPTNTIVFCDSCNVAVHQDCYGILFIPPGPWLCRSCIQKNLTLTRPYCSVCPDVTGPLKQTTCGSWVHVWCAVWVRELCFGNWHYLEPVEGIERIPISRWRLICTICKLKDGACIQCSNKNCFVAFHVSCARRAGFYMTPLQTGSLAEMALGGEKLECFCEKHSPEIPDVKERILDIRNEMTNCNTFAILNNIATGKNSNPLDDEISNIRKYPIAPAVFEYTIQNIITNWGHSSDLSQKLSCELCKYWSLKREFNDGAPLFEPSKSAIYLYNLLEDEEIKARLSFITNLLEDLERINELSNLIFKKNSALTNKFEKERLIDTIIKNPDKCLLDIIVKKFVNTKYFKLLEKLITDEKHLTILKKCREKEFKSSKDFNLEVNEMLDEIMASSDTNRLLYSSLSKAKTILNGFPSSTSNEILTLLEKDFIIKDGSEIKQRSWTGPILMRDEGLSDVEELNDMEYKTLEDIIEAQKRPDRQVNKKVVKKKRRSRRR